MPEPSLYADSSHYGGTPDAASPGGIPHGWLGTTPPPYPAQHAAEPSSQTGTAAASAIPLDYTQVRAIQQLVADKLAARLKTAVIRGEQDRQELGRMLIAEEIGRWADKRVMVGEPPPTPAQERVLAEAVFAAQFGLGRLQPLVDDENIENIEINGFDQVWLSYADGRLEPGPRVADSDEDLIAELQQLAARAGRSLSTADPRLHMTLADGSRLAAMIATVPRPQVVIRRHRVRDIDLDGLVDLGTVDPVLAQFLRACMRARKNIIVTGQQNAGKTTLIRALAHEIHPMERFATIEKEYELHLHDMPHRHPRVVAMQAREGNSEVAADGRPAGEVNLRELVVDALRLNLSRIIVGEVRGDEVVPMLQAMTTGEGGSLCTIHARSAKHAFERIVTLCLSGREGMTDVFGYRLAASAIDLIVNIRMIDETHLGGGRYRFVNEVYEVNGMGEGGRPATTAIFGPGVDGRAVPRHNPVCLDDLRRVGFELDLLSQRYGAWRHPLHTIVGQR